MSRQRNISTADFRTRLIAFLVVLVVGFVAGWVNGTSDDSSDLAQTGFVAQSVSESESDDELTSTPVDEQERPQDDDADAQAQTTRSDQSTSDSGEQTVAPERGPTVSENGRYTSKDEVALYIHTYGHLPSNFISKTKAGQRGWVSSEGNLDEVCPGMSIGGSVFYNDEGKLPDKRGRRWTECDINYHGGYRGAERIVFSNDGLIYYTGDHYKTFERLY